MLPVTSFIRGVTHIQAFFGGREGMQNIYVLCLYLVFFMNATKNLLMVFRDSAFRHVASVVRGFC